MNRKNLFFHLLLAVVLSFILTGCQKKIGIGSDDLFNTYFGLTRSEVQDIAPKYETFEGLKSWAKIDEKDGFELYVAFSDYGRVFGMGMSYNPLVKNRYQAEEIMGIPSYAHCNKNTFGNNLESLDCFRDF